MGKREQEIGTISVRSILIFAILFFTATGFSGTAAAQTPPRTKVVLTMGGDGLHFSTQHIAQLGGFFAEEGLDAETLDVGSGPRQVAALMGGSSAFSSLGLIHVIKANAEGANLVAISTVFDILDMQLILSNEAIQKAGIVDGMPMDKKVERLSGLRIAITSPGSTTDTYLRSIVRHRGFDPDKLLRIQPMGGGSNMLAAFEKGATDGFIWGAPQAHMALVKNIGKSVINPFAGDLPEASGVPYLVMVTSRQTLEQKPEVIEAGVRALARAMKFARENPEAARAIMRKHFPDIDEVIFNRAWEEYRKGIPQSPVLTRTQYDKTQAWLNITAASPFKISYDTVVAAGPAERAAAKILGK